MCALLLRYVTGDIMILADRWVVKFNCLQMDLSEFTKFIRLQKNPGLQYVRM